MMTVPYLTYEHLPPDDALQLKFGKLYPGLNSSDGNILELCRHSKEECTVCHVGRDSSQNV